MSIEIAPRVMVDSAVHFGKPVIKGTRVPVEILIGALASGMTTSEVADEYGISLEDVLAALGYAASVLSNEEVRASA